MWSTTQNRSVHAGYSLVEVLIVVAVIGVLSAIALSNLTGLRGATIETKDRRNAQNVASITTAAQAAGLNFVDPDGDMEKTIANAVEGGYSSILYMEPTFFGVPGLSEEEQGRVAPYLEITPGGQLLYVGKQN